MLQAEEAHGKAQSWGYTQVYNLKRVEHIWRCRGLAARFRADIRTNPQVADMLHAEYKGEQVLDLETRHVMCACSVPLGILMYNAMTGTLPRRASLKPHSP